MNTSSPSDSMSLAAGSSALLWVVSPWAADTPGKGWKEFPAYQGPALLTQTQEDEPTR